MIRVYSILPASALILILLPAAALAQAEGTLGTLGAGIAGESSTPGKWTTPTGPAPRTPSGRPDFNGVWDHPYVPDMSATNPRNPALQKGPGSLPYTEAGQKNIAAYDP